MQRFFIFAAVALVLIGCNNEMEAPRREIGFLSNVNRSIINEVEQLYSGGEGIKLFGTVSLDGKIIRLFDAEKLYHSSSTGWVYDNTRYWVPQMEHRFCAIWPYNTNCTFSDNNASVSLNHTTSSNGADLLYAVATRNLAENEDYSPVPITLHHACAALQFSIINASDVEVSSVSDIYLVGLQDKGSFTFGVDGTANWTLSDSVVAATDKTTFGGNDLSNLAININKKNSLYEGGAILVLPQEIANKDVKFHLVFKKSNANPEEKTIELGKLGGAAPTKWEAGKRYEYTLTVTENKIVSNVNIVPWVEHYVDL